MIIREIAASLYPWDLHDEPIDKIVDKLVEHSLVNSIYLVGVMHYEKRPLTSLYYTQNPTRKWYAPEDSRVYYRVDQERFKNTKMKPQGSERDFLKGTDWLDVLTECARRRGLKAGVEISHTFFDTKHALAECPDVLQKDIHGQPIHQHFCCNNPDVHEYMRVLFSESVRLHDVDFIQTCMMLFHQGHAVETPWFLPNQADPKFAALLGVATGGCFCEHCREKAIKQGIDWDALVEQMTELERIATATPYHNNDACLELQMLMDSNLTEAALLMEYPGLAQFLTFRMDSITEMFRDIYNDIKAVKPNVEFRFNNYQRHPELSGLDYKAVAPYLDSVRDSDYTEQRKVTDNYEYKRHTLNKIRRGIGCDKPLLAAFAVRPNATPQILKDSIAQLAQVGVDGFSLGHYDGSTNLLLRAVRDGMEENDIHLEAE
ncbi:hypothetical protein LJC74_07060 [Eubacteriales bacterium OttesenSCG-928-A19]|nr:hypothetical protein [Eubacteriales bacterium OttesenSCG-928-A19]